MTISTTVRKAGPYSGTGLQTAFPFYFKVFQASDVLVVQADTTGTETTQTLTTNYTVALNSDQNASPGGTVNMLVAPPSGYTLTVASQVPATQSASLTNGGNFSPDLITTALDKLTILYQQIAEQVSRAVTVTISSGLNPSALIASLLAASASAVSSASSATASATSASTSATNASASATSAATSATSASTSASTATTQASSATTSATTATTQATNAANSATSAAASSTSASGSASTATTQASNASASATSAANSATSAATSATNAASSATSAAASAASINTSNLVARTTASAIIPSHTTAGRDASPAAGYFGFNTTTAKFEGYSGTAWGSVGGGATGGGNDTVFQLNSTTVTTNFTLPTGQNAMVVGPLNVNSGVTVSIPAGQRLVIL